MFLNCFVVVVVVAFALAVGIGVGARCGSVRSTTTSLCRVAILIFAPDIQTTSRVLAVAAWGDDCRVLLCMKLANSKISNYDRINSNRSG